MSSKRFKLPVLGNTSQPVTIKDTLLNQNKSAKCEFADEMGMCEHDDLEDDMLCQRQECPWPDRKKDDLWWFQGGATINSNDP